MKALLCPLTARDNIKGRQHHLCIFPPGYRPVWPKSSVWAAVYPAIFCTTVDGGLEKKYRSDDYLNMMAQTLCKDGFINEQGLGTLYGPEVVVPAQSALIMYK